MEKRITSNVEDTREDFEEPIETMGRAVIQQQIWRDSMMIPATPPSLEDFTLYDDTNEFGNFRSAIIKRFRTGTSLRNLIKYYEKLPLGRIKGTTNCYSAPEFSDIITQVFGKTYMPELYINDNKLAFGVGKPLLDETAGTLFFRDEEFVNTIQDAQITISFYRYVGRKGTFGTDVDGGMELPFYDSTPHFVDVETSSRTATFKVRGNEGNTNYVLPPHNKGWYDKGDLPDTGVVVLQENIEDVIWKENVKLSGGAWVQVDGITNVYRHGLPSDRPESAEDNR